MAPKRSQKPDDTDDNDNNYDNPTWDSNYRNLMLYLLKLKRWLPKQHKQWNNFVRFGYIVNSRQEVVCFSDTHKEDLKKGFRAGTFEAPCMAGLKGEDAEDDDDSSVDSSALTHPPSARKPKSTTPDKSTLDTPGLASAEDEQFKIAPKALASFDEEVLDTILSTFEDEDTAEEYRDEAEGSARRLMEGLHNKARKISQTDDSNVEARADALYRKGIETASVKEFNAFKTAYSAFNAARRSPKPDTQLANDYIQVVNRLGETIEGRLESKLDFMGAHGNLSKTLNAIREVLGRFETNQETQFLLNGKSNQAFLTRDPRKDKKEEPKRFDTSKPWKAKDGPCPNQARGSGCDGKHWKKDCPNPNKIEVLGKKQNDKKETPAANPLAGKSNVARETIEEASAALFSSVAGSQSVPLDDVSSPAELLEKLTEGQGKARALMMKAEENEDSDTCPECDEDKENPSAISPSPNSPKLYVAAPSRGITADGNAPAPAGLYFGAWEGPDYLNRMFAAEQRVVSVDNLAMVDEACDQFNMYLPAVFHGPRVYYDLEPGKVGPFSRSPAPTVHTKETEVAMKALLAHAPDSKKWSEDETKEVKARVDGDEKFKVSDSPVPEEITKMQNLITKLSHPTLDLPVAPPPTGAALSPTDSFWRYFAMLACSCCACGCISIMTGLMVVLAFVLAREREPGADPFSNLHPAMEWIGLAPNALSAIALLTLAMVQCSRFSVSLYRRVRRRLNTWRRHGMGARTRPGFGLDTRSSSKLDGHSKARMRLMRITMDSICKGAPLWISLLLLLHWPVAILFEVTSALVGGRQFTVSPLRRIIESPPRRRSWFGASLAFGLRPTLRGVLSGTRRTCDALLYLGLLSAAGTMSLSLRALRVSGIISLTFGVLRIGMFLAIGGSYFSLWLARLSIRATWWITFQLPLWVLELSLYVARRLAIQLFFYTVAICLYMCGGGIHQSQPRPDMSERPRTRGEATPPPPAFRQKPPPAFLQQPFASREANLQQPPPPVSPSPPLPPSMKSSGSSLSPQSSSADDVAMCKPTVQGRALKSKLNLRASNSPKAKKETNDKSPSVGTVLRRLMHLTAWFIVDSGCTYHCHPTAGDLINSKPCSQHMIAANGSRHRITLIGDLPLLVRSRDGKLRRVILRNVRCVPTFTDTLVSVDQLWEDAGIEARFAGTCAICVPTQAGHCAMDLPFTRREGLFQWAVLPTKRAGDDSLCRTDETSRCLQARIHRARTTSHIAALPPAEAAAAIHRRLHINNEYLKRLPTVTSDAPPNLKRAENHSCEHCTEANATHLPHKGSKYKASHVGRLVHGDIVGPFKRSHGRGYQYMLVLVDDHSRFLAVRLLRRKSEALAGVRSFVAELNAGLSRGSPEAKRAVGTLHTDNAGEFLSKEFSEFLDTSMMNQTLCPPHVHQLNGTAERAIRSIMQQVRSNLVASGAPITFWPYAALHAVDVLNRVRCPPGSKKSSYEILTGEKPSIMDIMPFGCRAYAVKPSSNVRKTELEAHAWVGINLGLEADTPGAYNVWIPDVGRKVVTSEVYFDEGLMPWRPPGDQRVGPVIPTNAASPNSAPPPNLSGPAVTSDTPTEPAPTSASLPEAYDQAVRGERAKARSSRKVLLLFSGPKRRPDGLAAFLTRLGLEAVMVDADPENGGGKDDDILDDAVFNKLLERVKSAEFLAIIAAPPCSTFSISRFIKGLKGKGAPIVRTRANIRGVPNLDPKHRRELTLANSIVARTAILLAAAHKVGTQWVIENPADRGNPAAHRLWLHDEHGPVWEMAEIKTLIRVCAATLCTFPMCAFSAPWQKYTTLAFSAGFDDWLAPLNKLTCEHSSHEEPAGGQGEHGEWQSARAAAYPADFNFYLARAISALTSPVTKSSVPLVRSSDAPKEDGVETRARELRLPNPSKADPSAGGHAKTKVPTSTTRGASPPEGKQEGRQIDFANVDASPEEESESSPPPKADGCRRAKPAPFKRGLGSYPLRNQLRALLSKPARQDPRNRSEAHAQDSEGWTASEIKEIKNHLANKTFEVIDRSELPPGRKLVRWTWAYKWKRDGTQKSRLCVQGCSMVPGIDFDQTFCATLRSSSLRILGAIAAKLGLRLRRWDFTAAYLQGDLEEGEVIYCSMPPGYDVKGKDGQSRICRVIKPCYGMAQAGRRWQRALFPWIRDWNGGILKQTYGDSCVFHCRRVVNTPSGERTEWLLIGAYVDDLCVLYSHDDEHSLYHKFTHDLQKRWAVEDEGDVSDLLGIDISVEHEHVCLRQTTYIDRLASEFFKDGVPTTMQHNTVPCLPELPQQVLDAVDSKEEIDPALHKRYQSLVGALLYCATNTRPDIAFAVGMLCRAMSCPTSELMKAAERVLAYLIRNKNVGLRYAASERPLFGMTDSDWAVRQSTSGWVFILSSAAISWGSKRQPCVALSSCEAEIIAASEASKEAVYLKRFARELESFEGDSIELFEDNKGARDLSYNPEHHTRTKHIDRRHFFVREMVEEGEIVVPYVKSDDNLADFFTKPLTAKKFFSLRNKIMNLGTELSN